MATNPYWCHGKEKDEAEVVRRRAARSAKSAVERAGNHRKETGRQALMVLQHENRDILSVFPHDPCHIARSYQFFTRSAMMTFGRIGSASTVRASCASAFPPAATPATGRSSG